MRVAFSSVAEFHAASPARAAAPEVNYGQPWRVVRFGPAYRAAWLPSTGEFFVVRLGPNHAGGGRVELLAHVPDATALAAMLSGWREVCGAVDSMRWLRARVADADPLKARSGWP
jgi:hypothetical protein